MEEVNPQHSPTLTPEDGDGMEAVFYNFCGPGHVTLMAVKLPRVALGHQL